MQESLTMRNRLEDIIVEDPLLKVFHNLLETKEEKNILSMIFKNYTEEKILEIIINYENKKEKKA